MTPQETNYTPLPTAEDVQRAFDEKRAVEFRHKDGSAWFPALLMAPEDYRADIRAGHKFRAPKPAEPAEGRMDATVNKLLTDCYKAMTWAMAVIDPDEGPGREHSNASNALADCRVRIENLRALQAGPTKNEFGIPITTPTAERQVGGVADDPGEFGCGIEPNPKARYWQGRAAFWRSHAVALGYVPPGERVSDDEEIERRWQELLAMEGETANLLFLADNLESEGNKSRAEMVGAANLFIGMQEDLLRILLADRDRQNRRRESAALDIASGRAAPANADVPDDGRTPTPPEAGA